MDTVKVLWGQISAYNGQTCYVVLFLAALLFLWFTEKDRTSRVVFVYLTPVLMALFVCPLFTWVAMHFFMKGEDVLIYYRVFWYIPVGIVVCLASVRILSRMKTVFRKVAVGVAIAAIICLNGKLVYTNTFYTEATNLYHIPQNAIDVAEIIRMDKYWPKAVCPSELLMFIRQYTAEIYMPYGRNMVEAQWNFSSELYDAMEAEEYDTEKIADLARNNHCPIVVLGNYKPMVGDMIDQNYLLLGTTQFYYVYLDRNYYEIYKEQNLLDDDRVYE